MGPIKTMNYNVRNINGTADNNPPADCASWMDFWGKKTGLPSLFRVCHRVGCGEWADDGAHVQVEGHGNYWYIVPLCHADNMSDETFSVSGPLVPVNPSLSILK